MGRFVVRLLQKHPCRVAVQVFVLAVFQRPQECDQPTKPKGKRHGDQKDQNVHGRTFSRIALRTTRIEEEDIAAAAISGVASPAKASGMLTVL